MKKCLYNKSNNMPNTFNCSVCKNIIRGDIYCAYDNVFCSIICRNVAMSCFTKNYTLVKRSRTINTRAFGALR